MRDKRDKRPRAGSTTRHARDSDRSNKDPRSKFRNRDTDAPSRSEDAPNRTRSRDGQTRGQSRGPNRRRNSDPNSAIYLYGLHTVRAAFENKRRKIVRMLASQNAWERLEIGEVANLPFPVEFTEPRQLDKMLGKDAIHQGIVAEVLPLKAKKLNQLSDSKLVVVLDQVTDPHNVGAIMRSCVALGAGALITTARNSPQESGVLAKSASGALEMIEHIQVKNLGEAIEELHFSGFQTIGLDSEGPEALEDTFSGEQIALVLGAEGKGLRQKTRSLCTNLARLDMPGEIKSLNVSNAATLSLYAAHRFLHY